MTLFKSGKFVLLIKHPPVLLSCFFLSLSAVYLASIETFFDRWCKILEIEGQMPDLQMVQVRKTFHIR